MMRLERVLNQQKLVSELSLRVGCHVGLLSSRESR